MLNLIYLHTIAVTIFRRNRDANKI